MRSRERFGVVVRVDASDVLDDEGVFEFGRAVAAFDGALELGHSE